MRRFAIQPDISSGELQKDEYYELYNTAVNVLKLVDFLDPDRLHGRRTSEVSSFIFSILVPLDDGSTNDGSSITCKTIRFLFI
jgi:hypothetical protein